MGRLICFSGLDGSGKTTQAVSFSDWLNENGVNSIVYHTKNLENKRNDIMIKTLSYLKKKKLKLESEKIKGIYAAFTFDDIIQNIVKPDLENHDVVVIDRYLETQYFIYKLKGIDTEYSEQILDGILRPDINFHIDVRPEVCYDRIMSRSKKVMEHETLENLTKAYQYYHENYRTFSLTMVNGERTIEEIQEDIREQYESITEKW